MNTEFDKYIAKSADFAQPILNHLRKIVHEACPLVEEQMKWSFPNFIYKGSILCHMAAFKKHCTFGFWLGSIMDDPEKILNKNGESAMGQLGRIGDLKDLPNDQVLKRYILEAMRLTDEGVKLPKNNNVKDGAEMPVSKDLEVALSKNEKARNTFDLFSPSKKKEYIQWINEAKTESTKLKRLETAIEWLEQGKSKNWKYEKC